MQTDMGNAGAKTYGFEKAEITVEQSVGGMIAVVCFLSLPPSAFLELQLC